MTRQIVISDAVFPPIAEALGLPEDVVQRVILDFTNGQPLICYVQMLGSTKFIEIDWGEVLTGAKVIKVE